MCPSMSRTQETGLAVTLLERAGHVLRVAYAVLEDFHAHSATNVAVSARILDLVIRTIIPVNLTHARGQS